MNKYANGSGFGCVPISPADPKEQAIADTANELLDVLAQIESLQVEINFKLFGEPNEARLEVDRDCIQTVLRYSLSVALSLRNEFQRISNRLR